MSVIVTTKSEPLQSYWCWIDLLKNRAKVDFYLLSNSESADNTEVLQ